MLKRLAHILEGRQAAGRKGDAGRGEHTWWKQGPATPAGTAVLTARQRRGKTGGAKKERCCWGEVQCAPWMDLITKEVRNQRRGGQGARIIIMIGEGGGC